MQHFKQVFQQQQQNAFLNVRGSNRNRQSVLISKNSSDFAFLGLNSMCSISRATLANQEAAFPVSVALPFCRPRRSINRLCLIWSRGLVNPSATISIVGRYRSWMVLSATFSRV